MKLVLVVPIAYAEACRNQQQSQQPEHPVGLAVANLLLDATEVTDTQ